MKVEYSLKEIKSSFNAAAASQPVFFARVLRPISFYFTYIALRFGMGPNQATMAGLISGVVGSIFFMAGGQPYLLLGIFFYLFFLILDFVDGNIARVTDSATYLGKFLDGVVDTFVEVSLPLSLSIGYFLTSGSKTFLFAGIAVSFMRTFSSYVFTRLSFFNRWAERDLRNRGLQFSKSSLNPVETKRFPLGGFINITTDIKVATVLFIGITGFIPAVLSVMLAAIAVQAVVLIVSPVVDATHTLNIRRISKWDPQVHK